MGLAWAANADVAMTSVQARINNFFMFDCLHVAHGGAVNRRVDPLGNRTTGEGRAGATNYVVMTIADMAMGAAHEEHSAARLWACPAEAPELQGAKVGAGGGGRTHTQLPVRDFESRASASSATPARTVNYTLRRDYPKLRKVMTIARTTNSSGRC